MCPHTLTNTHTHIFTHIHKHTDTHWYRNTHTHTLFLRGLNPELSRRELLDYSVFCLFTEVPNILKLIFCNYASVLVTRCYLNQWRDKRARESITGKCVTDREGYRTSRKDWLYIDSDNNVKISHQFKTFLLAQTKRYHVVTVFIDMYPPHI